MRNVTNNLVYFNNAFLSTNGQSIRAIKVHILRDLAEIFLRQRVDHSTAVPAEHKQTYATHRTNYLFQLVKHAALYLGFSPKVYELPYHLPIELNDNTASGPYFKYQYYLEFIDFVKRQFTPVKVIEVAILQVRKQLARISYTSDLNSFRQSFEELGVTSLLDNIRFIDNQPHLDLKHFFSNASQKSLEGKEHGQKKDRKVCEDFIHQCVATAITKKYFVQHSVKPNDASNNFFLSDSIQSNTVKINLRLCVSGFSHSSVTVEYKSNPVLPYSIKKFFEEKSTTEEEVDPVWDSAKQLSGLVKSKTRSLLTVETGYGINNAALLLARSIEERDKDSCYFLLDLCQQLNISIGFLNKPLLGGLTPLMLAIETNYAPIVKLLLDRGANVNTHAAQTTLYPLMLAFDGGNINILSLLCRPEYKLDMKRIFSNVIKGEFIKAARLKYSVLAFNLNNLSLLFGLFKSGILISKFYMLKVQQRQGFLTKLHKISEKVRLESRQAEGKNLPESLKGFNYKSFVATQLRLLSNSWGAESVGMIREVIVNLSIFLFTYYQNEMHQLISEYPSYAFELLLKIGCHDELQLVEQLTGTLINECKVDINFQSRKGAETVLMRMVQADNNRKGVQREFTYSLEKIKQILEFKPNLALKNSKGYTAFGLALEYERLDVVDLLLESKDYSQLLSISDEHNALSLAFKKNQFSLLNTLVFGEDSAIICKQLGTTPLIALAHYTFSHEFEEKWRNLFEKILQVNNKDLKHIFLAKDREGKTALMRVVSSDGSGLTYPNVSLLNAIIPYISGECEILDCMSPGGVTPLISALEVDTDDSDEDDELAKVISILLNSGANPFIPCDKYQGRTFFSIGIQKNFYYAGADLGEYSFLFQELKKRVEQEIREEKKSKILDAQYCQGKTFLMLLLLDDSYGDDNWDFWGEFIQFVVNNSSLSLQDNSGKIALEYLFQPHPEINKPGSKIFHSEEMLAMIEGMIKHASLQDKLVKNYKRIIKQACDVKLKLFHKEPKYPFVEGAETREEYEEVCAEARFELRFKLIRLLVGHSRLVHWGGGRKPEAQALTDKFQSDYGLLKERQLRTQEYWYKLPSYIDSVSDQVRVLSAARPIAGAASQVAMPHFSNKFFVKSAAQVRAKLQNGNEKKIALKMLYKNEELLYFSGYDDSKKSVAGDAPELHQQVVELIHAIENLLRSTMFGELGNTFAVWFRASVIGKHEIFSALSRENLQPYAYSQLKKDLESLWFFLSNSGVSLAEKKELMSQLKLDIGTVCFQGAAGKLNTKINDIDFPTLLRREFLEHLYSDIVGKNMRQQSRGSDVHYAKLLVDFIARRYAVPNWIDEDLSAKVPYSFLLRFEMHMAIGFTVDSYVQFVAQTFLAKLYRLQKNDVGVVDDLALTTVTKLLQQFGRDSFFNFDQLLAFDEDENHYFLRFSPHFVESKAQQQPTGMSEQQALQLLANTVKQRLINGGQVNIGSSASLPLYHYKQSMRLSSLPVFRYRDHEQQINIEFNLCVPYISQSSIKINSSNYNLISFMKDDDCNSHAIKFIAKVMRKCMPNGVTFSEQALYSALNRGCYRDCEFLLNHRRLFKIDLNKKFTNELCFLFTAVHLGRPDLVTLLLDAGADSNARTLTERTTLTFVLDCISKVCQSHNHNPTLHTSLLGLSNEMLAPYQSIINLLLEPKYKFNLKLALPLTPKGHYYYYDMIINKHPQPELMLALKKADAIPCFFSKEQADFFMTRHKHLHENLRERGGMNQQREILQYNLFLYACATGGYDHVYIDLLSLLKANRDNYQHCLDISVVIKKDVKSHIVIAVLSAYSDIELAVSSLGELLECGANVNAQNAVSGYSLLMELFCLCANRLDISFMSSERVIDLLLENKIDLKLQDNQGLNALMHLVDGSPHIHNSAFLIKRLVTLGTLLQCDNKGRTAYDYAFSPMYACTDYDLVKTLAVCESSLIGGRWFSDDVNWGSPFFGFEGLIKVAAERCLPILLRVLKRLREDQLVCHPSPLAWFSSDSLKQELTRLTLLSKRESKALTAQIEPKNQAVNAAVLFIKLMGSADSDLSGQAYNALVQLIKLRNSSGLRNIQLIVKFLINEQSSLLGDTALLQAAKQKDSAAIALLLGEKANPFLANKQGQTAAKLLSRLSLQSNKRTRPLKLGANSAASLFLSESQQSQQPARKKRATSLEASSSVLANVSTLSAAILGKRDKNPNLNSNPEGKSTRPTSKRPKHSL